jgi:hypothetical protein
MNPIAPQKIAAIRAAARLGISARATARELHLGKDAVLRHYRAFFKTCPQPLCECGRPSTHRGQCAERAEKRRVPLHPTARLVHGYAGVRS